MTADTLFAYLFFFLFQAVRQGVDYDQFEQNVKGASLKPTRTKAGGNHGPGVLLHGGSGNAVPGLAKKMLNKEAGEATAHTWLGTDDSKKGDMTLCTQVKTIFAAHTPAEEEARRLYLSNSKEFVRRWRALAHKSSSSFSAADAAAHRYKLLRAVDPEKLSSIFKTEMEAEVMTDISANLVGALPRVCEIVRGEGVGGEKAAAAHAVGLMVGITKLQRFELNAKFLSKKEKQDVVTAMEWCVGVEPGLGGQAAAVRRAFGCV